MLNVKLTHSRSPEIAATFCLESGFSTEHEGKTRRGNKSSDVNYPWVDFKSKQSINLFPSQNDSMQAHLIQCDH
jgi:hypothetical protein